MPTVEINFLSTVKNYSSIVMIASQRSRTEEGHRSLENVVFSQQPT